MKFERPESEKITPATERIESDRLSKMERETIHGLLAQQERYGLHLVSRDNDPLSLRPLDVWDNIFRIREEMDVVRERIEMAERQLRFEQLPPSKKELYIKLRQGSQVLLKKEGLDGLTPESVIGEIDLEELPAKELERALTAADCVVAETFARIDEENFSNLLGRKIPNEQNNPEGYADAVGELAVLLTKWRHSRQEAAALQNKYDVLIAERVGDSGDEYLKRVQERIGE